ncbi:hypothetical protein, partial [Curtobacterium flaccumfaciens]|uniref:hypothetical protein n=1 Tax=Curtobacterium flaccumfaciens TaxID=2035 RepID=UPI003CF4E889
PSIAPNETSNGIFVNQIAAFRTHRAPNALGARLFVSLLMAEAKTPGYRIAGRIHMRVMLLTRSTDRGIALNNIHSLRLALLS